MRPLVLASVCALLMACGDSSEETSASAGASGSAPTSGQAGQGGGAGAQGGKGGAPSGGQAGQGGSAGASAGQGGAAGTEPGGAAGVSGTSGQSGEGGAGGQAGEAGAAGQAGSGAQGGDAGDGGAAGAGVGGAGQGGAGASGAGASGAGASGAGTAGAGAAGAGNGGAGNSAGAAGAAGGAGASGGGQGGASGGAGGSAGGPAGAAGSGGSAGGAAGESGAAGMAGGGQGGGAGSAGTSSVVSVDLGMKPGGAPFSFTVPAGALGFNLVASAAAPYVAIRQIVNPAGTAVTKNYAPLGGGYALHASDQGNVAAAVPQSDAAAALMVPPGTWQSTVEQLSSSGLPQAGPVSTRLTIQRTDDGQFHGGLLDLRLFIVDGVTIHDPEPAHPITAATAATDPSVQARLDAYFAALETFFGIGRGQVTYHAVDATWAEVLSLEQLSQLFALTAGQPDGPVLSMFWTQRLQVQGTEAWGLAPGIPGAVARTGTSASGIALALLDQFPAAGDGLTMLHETGHFLGLNHTSEFVAGYFDPLTDTPQCPTISPQSFLQCEDRNNLMFPAFFAGSNGGVGITVTDAQRRVVRGQPGYHAFANADQAPVGPPPPPPPPLAWPFSRSGRTPSALAAALAAPLTCSHLRSPGPLALARSIAGAHAAAALREVADDEDLIEPLRAVARAGLAELAAH